MQIIKSYFYQTFKLTGETLYSYILVQLYMQKNIPNNFSLSIEKLAPVLQYFEKSHSWLEIGHFPMNFV